MKVNEVMTREVRCIGPDATLHEAAEQMRELDVGVLPVCGDDKLVGMITDRDIVIRSVSSGVNPDEGHVRDVMTPKVLFCFEDQDVTEVADLMKHEQIRRLPILNRDKRLVGIVSLGDLALETPDEEEVGETLKCVSEHTKGEHATA
jgi:CBS domain-containing protein